MWTQITGQSGDVGKKDRKDRREEIVTGERRTQRRKRQDRKWSNTDMGRTKDLDKDGTGHLREGKGQIGQIRREGEKRRDTYCSR